MSSLQKKYERLDQIYKFILYSIVGIICSLIDIGIFYLLIYVHLNIYIASIVSVTIATIVNYFLSYKLAFLRGKFSKKNEIFRIFLISFGGLFISNLIFFLLTHFLHLDLLISKIIPIPLTLLWNFIGRRYFVFFKERPNVRIM